MSASVLNIPTRHRAEKTEIENLKQSASRFEKLLASHGLTEQELFADFRKLREKK